MANAAEHHHQRETAELLVFNLLLILTFLTVWLFKHRRFRFLHETGGAMFYGLLMGLILCYSTFQPDTESRAVYRCLNLNSSLNSLMVNISGQVYQYQYTREISRNNIHGNHGNEMLQKRQYAAPTRADTSPPQKKGETFAQKDMVSKAFADTIKEEVVFYEAASGIPVDGDPTDLVEKQRM